MYRVVESYTINDVISICITNTHTRTVRIFCTRALTDIARTEYRWIYNSLYTGINIINPQDWRLGYIIIHNYIGEKI